MLWSEVPAARAREMAADITTGLWIAAWSLVSYRLHGTLAGSAGVGRILQDGGQNLETAGAQIGATLGSIPVIGRDVGEFVRFTFAFAARPFLTVGAHLEHLLLISAALFSLIVLLVPLALWLQRYLPWRWERVKRLWAARRAVRASGQIDAALERLLASRAVHRLSYEELLKYSPDPLGDWIKGDYTRLAQAELASVGLQLRRPRVVPFPRATSG